MKAHSKDGLIYDHNHDDEGQVTFHTAASTAFPQPPPGQAQGPGPMTVLAGQLRQLLGITDVKLRARATGAGDCG